MKTKSALFALILTAPMASVALAADPAPTTATPAPATAAAPAAPVKFSITETSIGTLLDNPETKAVLVKQVPALVTNPQIDMARGMTLKQVQMYAGDALNDAKLAEIQADLDKLPTK